MFNRGDHGERGAAAERLARRPRRLWRSLPRTWMRTRAEPARLVSQPIIRTLSQAGERTAAAESASCVASRAAARRRWSWRNGRTRSRSRTRSIRGAYDQKRERVEASTPSVLPPMTAALPRNRLGFARLAVHRRSSADRARGRQSHVAGDLRHRPGEDRGRFRQPGRAPVASRTARLAGRGLPRERLGREALLPAGADSRPRTGRWRSATPEKLAKDPENRLLSRGPRFRMDARNACATMRWRPAGCWRRRSAAPA